MLKFKKFLVVLGVVGLSYGFYRFMSFMSTQLVFFEEGLGQVAYVLSVILVPIILLLIGQKVIDGLEVKRDDNYHEGKEYLRNMKSKNVANLRAAHNPLVDKQERRY